MRPCPETHRPRRAGLTMVELLVVILIIGILMALLLPAIGSAMGRARQAQVTAELNNLATALADFKNKYGDYPPSRLYCSETGDYSVPAGASADTQQLIQRSMRYIRKFWPRVQISSTGPITGANYDFNGNNQLVNNGLPQAAAYILQGPECLVLFLGGIPKATVIPGKPNSYAMTGFGRNPLNPFVPTSAASAADNRVLPFYEFSSTRLDDSDGNGVPCYLDTLGGVADAQPIADTNDKRPFAYFCSYGGGSYDPNDYNANELDDSSGSVLSRQFYVNFLPASANPVSSSGPNPYTVSGPVGGTATNPTSATFQNAESFQLLSSGLDRKWGIGGMFSGSGTPRTPFDTSGTTFYDTGTFITPTPSGDPRLVERDNLANFSGGRMD